MHYFEQYKVPQNIREHCLKVRDVAVFLAHTLAEAGVAIDIEVVDRMALFHDMFKMVALADEKIAHNKFHTTRFSAEELAMREKLRQQFLGMHESEIAYEILKEKYPEFAARLKLEGSFTLDFDTWEERVVRYVDMVVLGTTIVPLQQRVSYLREMYSGKPLAYWDEFERKIQKEEEKIFSQLSFPPAELAAEMNKAMNKKIINEEATGIQ